MSGVKVTFLRAEPIIAALRDRAEKLLVANEEVVEVGLFGSLVRGNYCPGSDADLLVILRKDPRRFVDRLDEFLIHFSSLGISVDVFPYTVEELQALKETGLVKSALAERVTLAERNPVKSVNVKP